MTAGERFARWIDQTFSGWADRLGAWTASWLSSAIITFIEAIEPEGLDFADESLAWLEEAPGMPDIVKRLIGKIRAGGKPIPLILLIPLAVLILFPMIQSFSQPLGRIINYGQERLFKSGRLDPVTAIRANWRGLMTEERMRATLVDHGLDEVDIETLLNVTKFYPAPADLVTWQAREVFEPAMVAKYGLDDELGGIEREPFHKAGMTDEQITNYWRAHWLHASWMQIVEMLHRGLVTEEDVYEWFKVVEIVPHWRDLLIQTAYTWPTRVDVRRWWDMRTIDETELRRLYSGMGYRGVNLDNYILWTKVYTDFPSLMARWSKGWITEDDVRKELTTLGMPAERVETMIQEKIKPEEAARVEEGKTLTKTEIYKGVKQGFITREEGIELITDLGYNRAEAEYLMDINVAVLEGSPETFDEFKDLTLKYRRAIGLEVTEMPEELKAAAGEVVRLTKEVKDLEDAVVEEKKKLLDLEPLPPEAEVRLKELQVFRNRAIAELERVKSDYDRRLAEWRHSQT